MRRFVGYVPLTQKQDVSGLGSKSLRVLIRTSTRGAKALLILYMPFWSSMPSPMPFEEGMPMPSISLRPRWGLMETYAFSRYYMPYMRVDCIHAPSCIARSASLFIQHCHKGSNIHQLCLSRVDDILASKQYSHASLRIFSITSVGEWYRHIAGGRSRREDIAIQFFLSFIHRRS